MKKHAGRAHSKFSASGAERWFNCPGSVRLSEGIPSKDTPWSKEGTLAHEVLELVLRAKLRGSVYPALIYPKGVDRNMIYHATEAADFILRRRPDLDAEVLVESRIHIPSIHPEMFGTFDGAVVDHFGALEVFDYKYGKGVVSPKGNLQMIFYAIGLASKYDWNFKRVRVWIIQPRIPGFDWNERGPSFWTMTIPELKIYAELFSKAVERVLKEPEKYVEGLHCHWCAAKSVCPLKNETRLQKALDSFGDLPIEE